MNIKIKSIALATMTYVLSTGLTQAALITTNTMPVSDDFSNFGAFDYTGGSVLLNYGATWTSTNSDAVIGNGIGNYNLYENGVWNAGRNGFTGLAAKKGSMTFSFESNVNYVGGFMNYFSPPEFNVIIEALDSLNNVLEDYTLNTEASIVSPGGEDGINEGAFRGISRDTFDIAAFRVRNAYVVLDDLTFNAAVPVPAALWLFGSGLLGLVAVARRKVRA